MRTALAACPPLHGIAHVPGILVSRRILAPRDLPCHTRLPSGRSEVGDVGIRPAGVFRLPVALAAAG
ncbi:MAG: hypothetical protein R6X22_06235 [Gemmatimonadota bacterium]